MITTLYSKRMISGYQPTSADNQRVGNTLSLMQTEGYLWKYTSMYVIMEWIKVLQLTVMLSDWFISAF